MGDFTQEAEGVIQRAKDEARKLNSYFVHDAHILLSLIRNCVNGIVENLLKDRVWYPAVLEKTEKISDASCPPPDAPWTVNAQNTLNEARKITKELGHSPCGTEHILAGLMRIDGSAMRILRELGFALSQNFVWRELFGTKTLGMESGYKQEVRVRIRWMILRDMPEVFVIESESFEFPWLEEDFIRCLRGRNSIGMVAEYDDRVVGFVICELAKTLVNVLNFAVAPDYRRKSVGTQMIAKLKGKLLAQRRTHITLEVRETNLPAQLFFKRCGFRAVSVLRNHYDNTEDAYLMQYRFRQETLAPFQPVN